VGLELNIATRLLCLLVLGAALLSVLTDQQWQSRMLQPHSYLLTLGQVLDLVLNTLILQHCLPAMGLALHLAQTVQQ
jgi:hypothetical protein